MSIIIGKMIAILLLSALISFTTGGESVDKILSATKYGEVSQNKPADYTGTLLRAWSAACSATASPAKVIIPAGSYALREVVLQGPCKSPIQFIINGSLKASANPKHFKSLGWITIKEVSRLTMVGNGLLDGNGQFSWRQNDCKKNSTCKILPRNLRLERVTDSRIEGIRSVDSKHFHVNLLYCKNVVLNNITLIAPDESPNTDGVHIRRSTSINITNSVIKTGDDCVSIGDETTKVLVEGVVCGPGHGMSIGSLGKRPNEKPVSGIIIRKCKLYGTTNGARIKTFQSAASPNTASDIHFEDITMTNVSNPIIIDQEYCPNKKCGRKTPSTIRISRVSFRKITGTSATPVAVSLICSSTHPCTDIQISDIDLKYSGGPAKSLCKNIRPTLSGKLNPKVCSVAPKGDETES